MPFQRTADPYRDTAVIDAHAPRFNQAVVAVLSAVAVGTGAWPLLALLALQLAAGVLLGRRFCLPCVVYFEWVQPRIGEGPIEDARAPRFANVVGVVFLGAAAVAYALGAPQVGQVLGATVAVLAGVATATGLCVGCEIYRIAARIRGIRAAERSRIDLRDLGVEAADDVVVQFTHPLCGDCQTLERRLEARGQKLVRVDVSRRGDLARKYGVAVVPLALRVRGDGTVIGEVH